MAEISVGYHAYRSAKISYLDVGLMKARFLTISILITLALAGQDTEVFSQDSLTRSISLNIGGAHYRFIDEAFAHERVRYAGTMFTFSMDHQRITNAYYMFATLCAAIGNASTSGPHPDANFTSIQVSFTYARRVSDYTLMKCPSAVFVGAGLVSSNYGVENVDDFDEATITANHVIALAVVNRIRLSSRNGLDISVLLPFAGFAKRTNYDGGINQELEEEYDKGTLYLLFHRAKIGTINPLRLPVVAVDFNRRIRPQTDLIVGYRFEYMKNTSIESIRLYGNRLQVGLRFYFNKPL